MKYDLRDPVNWTSFDVIGLKHRNRIFRIEKSANLESCEKYFDAGLNVQWNKHWAETPPSSSKVIIIIIFMIMIVITMVISIGVNFSSLRWNQHQLGRNSGNVLKRNVTNNEMFFFIVIVIIINYIMMINTILIFNINMCYHTFSEKEQSISKRAEQECDEFLGM